MEINLGSDDSPDDKIYSDYLNSLRAIEWKLLLDIIPLRESNKNENDKYNIRKLSILNSYIDVEIINKEASFNRFIKNKIELYSSGKKELDDIFSDIYQKYMMKWVNKVIVLMKEYLSSLPDWDDKINKSIKFIDFMINYKDLYKLERLLNLYLDIATILNSTSFNNDVDVNYIGKFIYWEWTWKKSLFSKILDKSEGIDTNEAKIIWIIECFSFISFFWGSNYENYFLLGYSMVSYIDSKYAHDNPEKVKNIILIDPLESYNEEQRRRINGLVGAMKGEALNSSKIRYDLPEYYNLTSEEIPTYLKKIKTPDEIKLLTKLSKEFQNWEEMVEYNKKINVVVLELKKKSSANNRWFVLLN